ncbi:hypothetical protein N7468_006569 [Penicillium chermesinum]|uniref:Major facilitator superfamily (MFS) profile domain-containing protein n=1 Tax=Penicillium chermesinum TaxID=63820 RepID=A0A9W9NSK8_9EURO|nr:uncharacterized protein N7468_006569 [Penicillium chermesinum]KAJ5225344.1 hypothetical protein N7468_006569 [Penicillium chermesinum]
MEANKPKLDRKDAVDAQSIVSIKACDDVQAVANTFQSDAEKRLVRKVDLTLMPTIWVLYLFSYADRTNIGNAKVAGMTADLGMSSGQYSLALVVFFISYIVFEVPSNLVLSKTRPSIYLPIIMTLWGTITCTMGAVKSPGALYAVRFMLGVLEAGFAPGVMLILSSWYKPHEQAKRFSIFYSAAVISGAFGGIVAGGISGSLDGAHGIAGWRWLFVWHRILRINYSELTWNPDRGRGATIACALIAVFILPDYPATTKRFTPEERTLAVERLEMNNVVISTEERTPLSSLEALRGSLTNWRTWIMTAGYTAIGGSATMSYFYPTLVAEMGYSSTMAEYMVVPIYAVAFFAVLTTGYLNDKIPNYRGLIIAGWLTISMICSIIICTVYNLKARYVFLVFMASGLLSSNASSLAYSSSTFASMPQETRAVSLAFVNGISGISQIYGAYLFPDTDAPKYLMGFAVISALSAASVGIYTLAHILIRKYPHPNP